MRQNISVHEYEPSILVEGPEWGDAEFYGKWLLMAAKAEVLWKEALNDPSFEKQIEAMTLLYLPHFGIGATVMISQLDKNFDSFTIKLNGEDIVLEDAFVMMVEMGFFVLTGQRYQMVIPAQLTMDVVKRAALKFAKTEQPEEPGYLHPEYLVSTMPYDEAKAWQARLFNMDRAHRCADRLLLLDDANGAA